MDTLTPRQKQIVDLFVSGKTYKEVGLECDISSQTVHPTLKAVRKKLGASGISRAALKEALESHG